MTAPLLRRRVGGQREEGEVLTLNHLKEEKVVPHAVFNLGRTFKNISIPCPSIHREIRISGPQVERKGRDASSHRLPPYRYMVSQFKGIDPVVNRGESQSLEAPGGESCWGSFR